MAYCDNYLKLGAQDAISEMTEQIDQLSKMKARYSNKKKVSKTYLIGQ